MFQKNPLIWIDHSGMGMYEGDDIFPGQHESFHNPEEASVVAAIYDHFRKEMGVPEDDIGIISCYWAQVAHIKDALEEINPEYSNATVRTIDGYQGKEKDVIIGKGLYYQIKREELGEVTITMALWGFITLTF